MSIDNFQTVEKMGVEEMVNEAKEIGFIISNPIEHYSMDEIIKICKLANENDLVFSIKEENSNFYNGLLINLVKRQHAKKHSYIIDHL